MLLLAEDMSFSTARKTPLTNLSKRITALEYIAAQRDITNLWRENLHQDYNWIRERVIGLPSEITLEGVMGHQELAKRAYDRIMREMDFNNSFVAAHYLAWAYGTNNRKAQQEIARKLAKKCATEEKFHPRNFKNTTELYWGFGKEEEGVEDEFNLIKSPVKDYLIVELTVMKDLRN